MDRFFIELNELLEKANLQGEEKYILEELAEYMVYPDRDPQKDPRSVLSRSIKQLKQSGLYNKYKVLIYNYQKKIER